MYSSWWKPEGEENEGGMATDHAALARDEATHRSIQSDETILRPLDLETIMSSKASVKYWYLHRPKTMAYVHRNAVKMQSLGRSFACRRLVERNGIGYTVQLAKKDAVKREEDRLKEMSDEAIAKEQEEERLLDLRRQERKELKNNWNGMEEEEEKGLLLQPVWTSEWEAEQERKRLEEEQRKEDEAAAIAAAAAAAAAAAYAISSAEEERVQAEQATEAERIQAEQDAEAERYQAEAAEAERIQAEQDAEAAEKGEEESNAASIAAVATAAAATTALAGYSLSETVEEGQIQSDEDAEAERYQAEQAEAERIQAEKDEEAERYRSANAGGEEHSEVDTVAQSQLFAAKAASEAEAVRTAMADAEQQEIVDQAFDESFGKNVPVITPYGNGIVESYNKETGIYAVEVESQPINQPSSVAYLQHEELDLDESRILPPGTVVDTPFGIGDVVGLDPHMGCYVINQENNDATVAYVQIPDVVVHMETDTSVILADDQMEMEMPEEIAIIATRIVDSRVVSRTGKKFVQYKLEITTSNYGTVFCWKRYSTFRNLCEKLVKEKGFKKKDLPLLPKRHILGNFNQKTIGERALKLNDFLEAAVEADHLQWGIKVDDQISVYKRRVKGRRTEA